MNVDRLPTSTQLLMRMRVIDVAVALPSLALISTYLLALLELRSGELAHVGLILGAYAVISAVTVEMGRRRQLGPIMRVVDPIHAGSSPSQEELQSGFAAALDLPRSRVLTMALMWGVPTVLVPICMALLGHPHWMSVVTWATITVTTVSGAVISGGCLFFIIKQSLESVREEFGLAIEDVDVREALIRPMSLGSKVQFVMLGTVLTTLMLTVTLAYSRSLAAVDTQAMRWQGRVLEALASEMTTHSFGEARDSVVPLGSVLPYRLDIDVIDADEVVEQAASSDGDERLHLVAAAASRENVEGRHAALVAGEVVSWRWLPEGELVIASIDRSELEAGFGELAGGMLLLTLMSCVIAVVLARLLSQDVRRAADILREEAARMASGDLRRSRLWESEDEMGQLGRAFERMGASLRTTVGGVAEAADRVEGAVGDISAVAQSVSVASADQVRRIQQASDLMFEINQQVRGVSDSAQALNLSVEESSSSILELGAAGDELNDTATVLSSKVDEVSGSIEQMVRSVKEVGSTAEQLSDAAGETSSSMEEMASAMRAVDTTAEMTADLSSNVVDLAERGQQRVSQTIDGMEAIRDATDAAERVIRGLGARTQEIGGILDVIDDVADETNLLALNAAIISAQAGEHGRAFTVVADEIKELADRVLASTKEIGGLIRSVQDESDAAVGAIEAGSKSVAGGVELSAEAGSSLEEITRAARESGTRIGEIVSAVREQTKATGHVVGLMEEVRDGVDHISRARVEQDGANEVVYRSAVTMQEVAQQVRRTTEEQSRGFGRIRESIEGVRGAVESINGSLRDQSSACAQVAEFLEQVADGTRSNEDAAKRMGESMRLMMGQAEALRSDVSKFQI